MVWVNKEIEICDDAGGVYVVPVHECKGVPTRFECKTRDLVGVVISCNSAYYKITECRALPDRCIYDIKPFPQHTQGVDSYDGKENAE